MTALPVSVVVVSRGRPDLLIRCLTGLAQLCYRNFEIVVAADRTGHDAVCARQLDTGIKLLHFDEANISRARNAALARASGEVVAFIDDDAVPEPSWLDQLSAPFLESAVTAAGGFVIGRNGITFQWTARAVDRLGRKTELEHSGEAPFVPMPPAGFSPKTEGTNFAVRRDHLVRLGGFDPAFRFYMDETDLNRRIAAAGGTTVMVPRAIVHHGFAASTRRAGDRAPTDLTEIGASSAVFLRKHAPGCIFEAELARLKREHRMALVQYMVDGGLEPRDVSTRLEELAAGFAEGLERDISPTAPLPDVAEPFKPLIPKKKAPASLYFAGRPWNRKGLRAKAKAAVAAGDIVTIFRFSPTALPHRVRFHEGGWWEQRGGLFGRASRDEPYFRLQSFRARLRKEWARVAVLRQCGRSDTKS